MNTKQLLIASATIAAVTVSFAGELERPTGFKVGERLTLRPYVSLSYTYDSNVDSSRHGKTGSQWSVEPGVAADYIGDNWKVDGRVWYQYHAYNRYTHQLNSSSYGEQLGITWSDSLPNEKGWSFKASERYSQIAQDDDMSNSDGRGQGRDRQEFSAQGVLERRLNQNVHLAADLSYYFLDYENNVKKYAAMYGWERFTLGGEVGYMASRWTDFILASNYQWYSQDNNRLRAQSGLYDGQTAKGKKISKDSRGWTVMGGIATRATERIEYRLLGGYSRFDYGSGAKTLDGFTYQTSARWAIEDRLSLMMLASSYFQPSENSYGTANKVYNFSIGLAKAWVRGKLTSNIDFNYRKETVQYAEYTSDEYDRDIWTGRIGFTYNVNRYVSLFSNLEYQSTDSDRKSYQYDRWRGTVGMRLSY